MIDTSPFVAVISLFAVVALAVVLVRAITVVRPYERYVVTDGEEVETVLGGGVHVTAPFSQEGERVDVRSMQYQGVAADLETSDGVEVAFDVTCVYRVTDPAAAVTEPGDFRSPPGTDWSNYQCAILERVDEVVADRVTNLRWEDLQRSGDELATACERDLASAFETYGVELEEFSVGTIERAGDEEGGDDEKRADGDEPTATA